jgi:D-tagatose-1,6-bisphosphate aldolase subunit GatZ/KbaZ
MPQVKHPLKRIVEQNNQGKPIGLYSVCSANPYVIRAGIRDAVTFHYPLIVESTANQVNQFGGYTGMKPSDFVTFVKTIASEEGLPESELILGGDHLGPLTWTDKTEVEAMKLAKDLVYAYASMGFTKIHLDTSMKVADDASGRLDPHICAARGAILAQEVERGFRDYQATHPNAIHPALVVGSEVPIPGGSQEHEDSLTPTNPNDFLEQVVIYRKAFSEKGLHFDDVCAFVVQPGVEFGDDFAFQYDREKAARLVNALKKEKGLVFEGHSTDYQTTESLSHMVEDGVAILKVGPAFTFRLRETLFLLEEIEKIILPKGENASNFKQVLLKTMDDNPKYWKKYYQGTPEEIAYKKFYSYSDRCRYYLPEAPITESINTLIGNLPAIPEALLSQYLPIQYKRYMEKLITSDATSILIDSIQQACHEYAIACHLV